MSYAGDSAPKKLTRIEVWSQLIELGGDTGDSAFFCGPDGADFGVLAGFCEGKAPPVIAADTIAASITSARARWPELEAQHIESHGRSAFFHGDIRSADLSRAHRVFMDFCSPLSRKTYEVVSAVARLLPQKAGIACAFLKGRDRAFTFDTNRTARRLARKGRTAQDRFVTASLRGENLATAAQGSWGEAPDIARCRATLSLLSGAGNIGWSKVFVYKGSSPMIVVVGQKDQRFSGFEYIRITATDEEIRARAIADSAAGFDAAALYNIDAGTLRAWKAHSTRGTYSSDTDAKPRRRQAAPP